MFGDRAVSTIVVRGVISVFAGCTRRKSFVFGGRLGRLVPARNSSRPDFGRKFPRKTILALILLIPFGAGACGWWGDGEMNRDQLLQGSASGGRHIPLFLDRDSITLPGNLYGIAITEPGLAQPYLQSTYGRPISNIEDLGAFGFRTIIDLGPPGDLTSQEFLKGSRQRIRYCRVPNESLIPGRIQVSEFRNLVLDAGNLPALVVAPAAEMLAGMWAAYRLELGAPLSYTITEAVSMGLRPEQEATLIQRHQP